MLRRSTHRALALVAAAFAFAAPDAAFAGRFCGARVESGEAIGKTEDEAKTAATVWWSSRAGSLGKGYEIWADAADKSLTCHPGPLGKGKCKAAAKACLPGGVAPSESRKQDL